MKSPKNPRGKLLKALRHGLAHPSTPPDVVVVGAGIAGLTAALILQRSGVPVTLLEAQADWGGRICTFYDPNFADSPLELGAEWVHGRLSAWADYLHHLGFDLYDYTPDVSEFYWHHHQLRAEDAYYEDEEYWRAVAFMDDMYTYRGRDRSLAELLREAHFQPFYAALVRDWLEEEYGTSLEHISTRSLCAAGQGWSAGYQNLALPNHSMGEALEALFADIRPNIVFDTSVKKIDYQAARATISSTTRQTWRADKVLVTVPLGVLKAKQIQFVPALPRSKSTAIRQLGMGSGMKVVLKFAQIFWDNERTNALYGSEWVNSYYPSAKTAAPILTAYVMGDKATRLRAQGSALIEVLLDELNEMFGNRQASFHYLDNIVMDWGTQPYTLGAYSYPSVRAGHYRQILAQPLNNSLFFAGEATHVGGHAATVHGAMETGYRAALEILDME